MFGFEGAELVYQVASMLRGMARMHEGALKRLERAAGRRAA